MQRANFSSRFGFVVAAAGSAVGLGNIWKFPFEVGQNGGAAFVFVYLFFCFLLCYPIIVAEIAIGRHTRRDAVGAFVKLGFPKWKIIGLLGVTCSILILSFYNVIAAWVIGYLFEMTMANFAIADQFSAFTSDIIKVGLYALIFMTMTAYVVSRGISGGIESAARILMPCLIIVMLGITVYGLTLPGATAGLSFYLQPDLSAVNTSVVFSALGQAFFSLSLGMGTLITLGSYLPKESDIVGSATMITTADVAIAFMAGLLIFPLVFSHGIAPDGGETLIFEALPKMFESLGNVGGAILGGAFFLLLAFAALTSTVSMLEVPTSYLVDDMGLGRKLATVAAASTIFLVSIPSLLSSGASNGLTEFVQIGAEQQVVSFMSFVGLIASDTLLPVGGFLLAVFTAYVWRTKNLEDELMTEGVKVNPWILNYLNISLRFICPSLLALIVVVTITERFLGIPVL